jgi:hypothetical protein
MVYFQSKNANLGKFWECLAKQEVGKFYGHFVSLLQFCIFYGRLVYCFVILVCFSRFGMLYQEKYGIPG